MLLKFQIYIYIYLSQLNFFAFYKEHQATLNGKGLLSPTSTWGSEKPALRWTTGPTQNDQPWPVPTPRRLPMSRQRPRQPPLRLSRLPATNRHRPLMTTTGHRTTERSRLKRPQRLPPGTPSRTRNQKKCSRWTTPVDPAAKRTPSSPLWRLRPLTSEGRHASAGSRRCSPTAPNSPPPGGSPLGLRPPAAPPWPRVRPSARPPSLHIPNAPPWPRVRPPA